MSDLKVFRGLPIPVDYAATMKYAVLAKSNGGKTYMTLKFEEQLCDAGAFFVTLDPVGKHWALRVGKDGQSKGGKDDVYVLGGLHGDVPLEAGSGALIADTVLDHPGRYVIDVSQFETDSEQDRFALDFAKRLFRRKAKDPGFPLLLILEEAESFIPQQPRPNQAPMLGAFGRIARQGRNHGLGLWMVAQRSAALNKGVLSQADVLIVKEMSHKRDRDAVDDWVEANGTKEQRDEVMASLASLKQDDAWVWSPGWLECFERVKVLPRVTFDSSANVRHGEAAAAVEMTPLDVDALGKAIAATAERAKADDPRELRRRIAELERDQDELVRLRQAKTAVVKEEVEVLVPTLPEGHKDELVAVRNVLDELTDAPLHKAAELAENATAKLEGIIGKISEDGYAPPPPSLREQRKTTVPTPRRTEPTRPPIAPPAGSNGGSSDLGKAHRAILTVLAQRGPRSKQQVALETGYSAGGGGFNNAIGKLRTLGYVHRGDPIVISSEGEAALGTVDPLPTGAQLLQHWMNHSQVPKAGALVLEAIDRTGPASKEELAEMTGYEASGGGFNNALGRLRTLGLITRGSVIDFTDEFADALRS